MTRQDVIEAMMKQGQGLMGEAFKKIEVGSSLPATGYSGDSKSDIKQQIDLEKMVAEKRAAVVIKTKIINPAQ